MFQVPVTFLFDFERVDDSMRPYILHEFAANGTSHLVLSDTLISMIMRDYTLLGRLRNELKAEGLDLVDAHSPFGPELDLNCPHPQARKTSLLRHTLALDIAAELGVNTITIHEGNSHHWPDVPLETQIDLMRGMLEKLLTEAEARGITVCIENIWFPSSVADVLLKLKADLPSDSLGFCYDAGHANLVEKGLQYDDSSLRSGWAYLQSAPQSDDRILEKMLPHVVNCHLHDNDGQWDYHRNIGCGNIDWKHVIPLLKSAPRLKCIQSEVIPARTNSSIRDVCEAFRKLGEL